MEPADNPQAQLIISELKTDLHKLLTALQTTAHDRSHTLQQHTTNYELLLRQQSLRDATKSIRTFEPGSDVNRFITDLNKAYTIHVKPELREYPEMEKEFVKLAKQLLNQGIFQQMEDSRTAYVHVRGTKGLPYIHPREPNDKLPVPKPSMGPSAT